MAGDFDSDLSADLNVSVVTGMTTVADLQTKIAAIPWANQEQLITGPLLLDLFLTLASLLGVDPFADLPTSQPSVAGVTWNDNGVISRS